MISPRPIRRRTLLTLLSTSFVSVAQAAPSPVGYWTTIDDDGKTATSIVQIEQRGDLLFGKIVRLINPEEKNPICDKCKDDRKNQPVVGMEILRGLKKDGEQWSGGHVLDPKNGKTYSCLLGLLDHGATLKVRGYIGMALLGRTQKWRRAPGP